MGAPEIRELKIRYCEMFLSFLLDILSQIPTRRFFRSLLLHAFHLIPRCLSSSLYSPPSTSSSLLSSLSTSLPALSSSSPSSEGRLFSQLVDLVIETLDFPIEDLQGRYLFSFLSFFYSNFLILQFLFINFHQYIFIFRSSYSFNLIPSPLPPFLFLPPFPSLPSLPVPCQEKM